MNDFGLERGVMIRAERLTKKFGGRVALDRINLEIAGGETVALIGPNGAGKTTLLMVLATLLRSFSGEARVGSHDIRRNFREARRCLGVVANDTFLYRGLSAEENLLFYARLYGIPAPRSVVNQMLEMVGMTERRHERPDALSRGMRQRLSIARALLHNPPILLLDEPESGLDRDTMVGLWEQMRMVGNSPRTIIMATHNLERGLVLTGRIIMLHRGRLVLDRPAAGLSGDELGVLYDRFAGDGH